MRKIVSCEFNIDTACVGLRLDDETLLFIDCTAVENEVENSMHQRLVARIFNKIEKKNPPGTTS